MTNIIIAGLIVSQTIFIPYLSFRWIKEYSVQIMAITALCAFIWEKNKWLASYIAWSMLMFIVMKGLLINDYNNKMQIQINMIAVLNLINIVLYGVIYLVMHNPRIVIEKVEKTLCLLAVFQSIYVIMQKFQFDQLFANFTINGIRWPVGTWANESLVAWFIAICSPFFLRFKDLRFKVGYFICFLAILATKVSAGILAFVVAYLFWLYHNNKRNFKIALYIVMVTGFTLLMTGKMSYYLQDTHRFKVWAKALEICKELPLTGHGIGSFRDLFYRRALEFSHDGHWAQAHNEWIQVYFEQGLIGLGIILGLVWTAVLSFVRHRRGVIPLASLMALAVTATFGFPMHTGMGVLAIVSLALYEREVWGVEQTL